MATSHAERRCVHPGRQGDPGAQGLAPRLCPMEERGGWQTAITPISPPSSPRRPASSSPPRTPTASPISSIAAGRPGFLRVLDDTTHRLRRFLRQPAVHHPGQPGRQSQGASVPDRLRQPAAHQDLGRGARRRGRCRADRTADARRLQGAARAGDPVHGDRLGLQLPAAHPAALRGRRRRGGAGRTGRQDRRLGSRGGATSGCRDGACMTGMVMALAGGTPFCQLAQSATMASTKRRPTR